MTGQEFEARILGWAKQQSDVEALIQIGSRVQAGAEIDQWSDWDYHLISSKPRCYHNTHWPVGIAPVWSAHLERTDRGVTKLSAVYEQGFEADFVLLTAWQMKLVYWAMRRPYMKRVFPRSLTRGIQNTQLIVGRGYRVLIGGSDWEERLKALSVVWPQDCFSAVEYAFHVSGFWRHAVWIGKKIARTELLAAVRWYYVELSEHRWALLEEEARLLNRAPRPEARKAELWLDKKRSDQLIIETGPDQRILAKALLSEILLFEEVSRSVATSRGFQQQDYSAVAAWLRAELTKIDGSA